MTFPEGLTSIGEHAFSRHVTSHRASEWRSITPQFYFVQISSSYSGSSLPVASSSLSVLTSCHQHPLILAIAAVRWRCRAFPIRFRLRKALSKRRRLDHAQRKHLENAGETMPVKHLAKRRRQQTRYGQRTFNGRALLAPPPKPTSVSFLSKSCCSGTSVTILCTDSRTSSEMLAVSSSFAALSSRLGSGRPERLLFKFLKVARSQAAILATPLRQTPAPSSFTGHASHISSDSPRAACTIS